MRAPICHRLAIVLFLIMPGVVAAQKKARISDATLRQLEKDIAAARGLEFKKPVVAKTIARGKGAAKNVQGYYDIKQKTLYLYDDIKGSYERGVLIHEMVHALQDQHFNLKKLYHAPAPAESSDADLAMAALVEGDATLTMIEVLKKDQPKVAAMLDTSLEKAKNLRNAFLYGIGAQYVKRLKDKGGWAAVDARYRFPPRATSAILSPDGANTIDLGPGRRVGAFGIIALLAENADAKPLAVQAMKGLIGDRVVADGAVKTWQLAFHSDEYATRFQNAYAAYRLGPAASEPLALRKWRGKDGTIVGVGVRGSRVWVVEAPNDAALAAAIERLDGPIHLEIWGTKERRRLSFGELADRLLDADLVCVGETHDSELCHCLQLQIIKALYARDARLGVGMEMFQRPYQESLDKYVRGDIGEAEMLKATEYATRWGYHWSLYQPIADFCRRNAIPLAALNAPKELTGKISKGGFRSLTDADKKALGPIDFHVPAHREHWYETLAKMHGNTKASEDQKERSYQVMTVWDEYMADSAATFQMARRLRRMVVLAGSGHIDLGFGIPQRAAQRTGGRTATIHVAAGGDAAKHRASPPTDYVVIVR